jgi:hypothetical protein
MLDFVVTILAYSHIVVTMAAGLIWACAHDVGYIHARKADVEREEDPKKKLKQDRLDLEIQQRLLFDGLG